MKECKWLDLGPPWFCYLKGIQMDDIYVDGKQVNKDAPIPVRTKNDREWKLMYPFCKGGPCKELLEQSEEALIKKAKERNDKVSAGRTI